MRQRPTECTYEERTRKLEAKKALKDASAAAEAAGAERAA
jgi:hypothetical protein